MRTATGDNQLPKLRVGGKFIPALRFFACRTASAPRHMPGAREKGGLRGSRRQKENPVLTCLMCLCFALFARARILSGVHGADSAGYRCLAGYLGCE